MLEINIYKLYQLDPAPQQRTPQECIELYLETGDAGFFAQFLHWHEPAINAKAKEFAQKYAVQGHFSDLKQRRNHSRSWESRGRFLPNLNDNSKGKLSL